MTILLIIAVILLGVAVWSVVRALSIAQGAAGESLRTISVYGFAPGASDDAALHGQGAIERVAERLGTIAGGRLGSMAALRKKLITAGMYQTPAGRFVGYQVMLAIGLPLAWLLFSGLVGASGVALVFGFIGLAVFGLLGPAYFLARKGRTRQELIDRELPELIDLLVVTVEAGVGFAGALRVAADRMRGPLAEELRLTLQEQNMGLNTSEALRNLGDRCPTPGVRIFVRSVMQGETLGVSMGQIMRNVALEMRKRRRASAEERAQKAPVKMLFPLIFLIFPAMFIVLLVPAILAFVRALS